MDKRKWQSTKKNSKEYASAVQCWNTMKTLNTFVNLFKLTQSFQANNEFKRHLEMDRSLKQIEDALENDFHKHQQLEEKYEKTRYT